MSNAKRFSPGAVQALFVFLVLLAAPTAARAQDPAGHWDGQVELPGGPLEVHLDLKHTGAGWSGTILMPTESDHGMPINGVKVSGRHVSFGVAVQGGPRFDGTLEKKGTRLDGTFKQAGFDYTFRLVRAKSGGG